MLLTHSYFIILFFRVTFFWLFWFWPFLFSLPIMFFLSLTLMLMTTTMGSIFFLLIIFKICWAEILWQFDLQRITGGEQLLHRWWGRFGKSLITRTQHQLLGAAKRKTVKIWWMLNTFKAVLCNSILLYYISLLSGNANLQSMQWLRFCKLQPFWSLQSRLCMVTARWVNIRHGFC